MFMPILEGLDGVEKMSKSLGNYIGVNEPAEVMFKKVMEVPDSLIIKYYELCTDEHPDTIDAIKAQLAAGANPRDIKYGLAKVITSLYHSEEEVQKAISFYDAAFSKKAIPDDIPELTIAEGATIGSVALSFVEMKFVPSKSEFIRMLKQGGVQLNSEKIGFAEIDKALADGDVLKIGKKNFVKFIK
jgi:tyrosyl-tRNA synthetase